ncbi:unnamed protein product [Phytophthora lilii]|uniref:Unnamed protein product n=1 Tax=Phytophthora lilii TaxID=2077276 RepID=A0A9W6WNW6_9STRA|nr:unnamed protein product [Phytophthora lilii]
MLPVWEVDGTHMKPPAYNGVCLILLGKDGDKRNIPVAVAYVHKETIDNFAWFFTNCKRAGIKLDDRVTFTDRGKQLGAQELMAQWGLKLHLKFCSLHLRFNVMDKFKSLNLNESWVNSDVFRLQSSHSTSDFDGSIARMKTRYPVPITKSIGGKTVHEFMPQYLHDIHPTSWSIIGNMRMSDDEKAWLKSSWNEVEAYGEALPLFGVRTTSGVEGDNNGLLWGGARTQRVYKSLRAFCLRAISVCAKRLALGTKWKASGFDLTPHAMKLMKQEAASVGKQTVMSVSGPVFLVFDAFGASGKAGCTKLYEVNMASGQCSRCVVSEQLQIPCRHIQAVIYKLASENKAVPLLYKPLQYFHSSYSVATLHAAMTKVSIHMPVDSSFQASDAISPPPYYLQAGKPLQRSTQKRDRVRGSKRKRNKGEGKSKRAARDADFRPTSPFTIGEYDEVAETTGCEEEEGPAIAEFFATQLSAATVKARQPYRCSQCGETGHNSKTCTNTNPEREEAGIRIEPGKYLVGDCPFAFFGIQSGYDKQVDS